MNISQFINIKAPAQLRALEFNKNPEYYIFYAADRLLDELGEHLKLEKNAALLGDLGGVCVDSDLINCLVHKRNEPAGYKQLILDFLNKYLECDGFSDVPTLSIIDVDVIIKVCGDWVGSEESNSTAYVGLFKAPLLEKASQNFIDAHEFLIKDPHYNDNELNCAGPSSLIKASDYLCVGCYYKGCELEG